ncbi:MAG: PrsW family glutamic-type intramembrane protease [Aggregatilineales bacterium]
MTISTIIAFLVAIAIPVGAVYLIFTLDLFGTGKHSTIFISLGWGAVGAFTLAYILNETIMRYIGYESTMTITGPIVEEMLKAIVLVYLITRPTFHYAVDGAVYGFAVGIGFAVTENILYITTYPATALAVAISRTLSTSLMHATTSALIGITLGNLRRSDSGALQKLLLGLLGFVPAAIVHIVFNNLVKSLTDSGQGTLLLLLGFSIGLGGAGVIGVIIMRTLANEKKRFAQTLGIGVGVSTAERKFVQQLGGEAIETVLKELGAYFGADKIVLIRKLLITQANIGILQNNLSHPVSERLRQAWQNEIKEKRAEINKARSELGVYVMSFLRGVFPDDDEATRNTFQREFAITDPTQIHTFDMFVSTSRMVQTISPEHLSRIADLLKQIELFKDVSLADLENLSRAITTRKFRDGELIFDEGQPGDEMFVVTDGTIQILSLQKGADTTASGEKLLNVCKAGDIVGELTLLDGYSRSARARAGGETEAFVLRRDQFMMFISSRPAVILALLRFLTRRARHISAIVDVSVKWASDVAQGHYDHAVGNLSPAWATAGAAGQSTGLRASGTFKVVDHPESASVSEETPALLQGVFSRVSSSLQSREKKAGPAVTAPSSPIGSPVPSPGYAHTLAALPPDQQLIVRFLQDGVANADLGATIQAIEAELTEIAEVPATLAELIKSGWLVTSGNYYRISPRRRRATVAMRAVPAAESPKPSLFSRIDDRGQK